MLEPHGPACAHVGKLSLVDQVILQRDDREEEVAINVEFDGHDSHRFTWS